jgi:DNA-binding NarL/FixJ family response regulator
MRRARILLAEDSPAVARQLRLLLANVFDVSGFVDDGIALRQAFEHLRPDVLVSDISMPGMDGLQAIERLQEEFGPLHIVFVTVHADEALVARAMALGPCGYVLKPDAGEDLIAAVHSVLAGKPYVSSSIAKAMEARGQPAP